MKARDIIPGWPRGTSTSKPYGTDHTSGYHKGQADMMDDWHRSGGQGTSALTHGLFAGTLTRPDFFSEGRWGLGMVIRERMSRATQILLDGMYTGRHYYEPLEEHTYPTYGGITRGDHPTIKGFEVPDEVGHITPKLINDFFSRLATRREIQATKAMLKEGKNGE